MMSGCNQRKFGSEFPLPSWTETARKDQGRNCHRLGLHYDQLTVAVLYDLRY
jgi:hypothetical protein